MEWGRIEGNWKLVRSNIRKKWARLTEEDLAAINGRRDELEGKIQQRYGFALEHVRKEVDDWVRWQPAKPRRKVPGLTGALSRHSQPNAVCSLCQAVASKS